MKTPRCPHFVHRRMLRRFPSRVIVVAVLAAAVSGGISADAPSEPKDHTVFIGIDVTVPRPDGIGHLRSVSRNSAEIVVNGAAEAVPLGALANINFQRVPKLSAQRITLSNLKGTRTYSVANDPALDGTRRHAMMQGLVADANATARAEIAVAEAQRGMNAPVPMGGSRDATMAARQSQLDRSLSNRAGIQQIGKFASTEFPSADDPGEAGAFDAFQLTFELAAPERMENAYAVLLMSIRPPDHPSALANMLTVQRLALIDPQPRRIQMVQTDLPKGFAPDHYEVHVYADGREIATNLSERRVEVSRSEAQQFLILRRVLTNKHANLPAEVMRQLLPVENRVAIPADQLHRSAELHVNGDGAVTSVTLDTAGSPTLDASIEAAVRRTPFYPALANGESAESRATIVLSELVP